METPEARYQALFADALPGFTRKAARRAAAMASLAFPQRAEAWRFTPPRRLLAQAHAPGGPAFGALPPGASDLAGADPRALEHLGKVARDDGFLALNVGFCDEVAVVHARAGESVGPLSLSATHAGLSTPRVLVVAEPGARVSLAVRHAVGVGLAVPIVEIAAMDGAEVELVHAVAGDGDLVASIAVGAGAGARVAVRSLVTSAAGTQRIELDASLGPGAALDTSGLVLGRGAAHVDHQLEIHHAADGATSAQSFRHVLDGRARAVFTGQVTVEPHIRDSDAAQSVRTLLLADGPSVVTRPWLEIHNDQVKASHGATVGQLDPEALFYLRARGLGSDEARRLLTRAFVDEIVGTFPEPARDDIAAEVAAWLGDAP